MSFLMEHALLATIFAFVVGMIALRFLKEQYFEERESRLWAFALGAGTYAALLLIR